MILCLLSAALASPPNASAVVVKSRSAHLQLIGQTHWPTGVSIPLTVRNRHDHRAIKVEPECEPVVVFHDGMYLAGGGERSQLRRLGPSAEGSWCTWDGTWADGSAVDAGRYGLVVVGRVDGHAVVDGGGGIAKTVEIVAPEPIQEGVPTRVMLGRGFVVTPDERVVIGFGGPGMFQPGLTTAELRVWANGKAAVVWLSRSHPDDPMASKVVAGWRVTLGALFPDGTDSVELTVTPK